MHEYPGIEAVSPALASGFFTTRAIWEALLKPYFTLSYKRPLRALTKENTLILIAVDIGHKNTQE